MTREVGPAGPAGPAEPCFPLQVVGCQPGALGERPGVRGHYVRCAEQGSPERRPRGLLSLRCPPGTPAPHPWLEVRQNRNRWTPAGVFPRALSLHCPALGKYGSRGTLCALKQVAQDPLCAHPSNGPALCRF